MATSKNTKESNSITSKKEILQDDRRKLIKILEDESVPYHEALATINNELTESVREVEFEYELYGFLEDSAYALHRAVQKIQGYSSVKDDSSPSGGKTKPTLIDIKFADGTRIKVPYGTINLPQFGPNAYIDMSYSRANNVMHVKGTCEKRYTELMDEIINKASNILDTDSIYKNKAIKYEGKKSSPEFIDLSKIDDVELFLTPEAKFATEPIEARIEKCDECSEKGIDLKFGVLLEGSYGTGKTLYANKLAAMAIKNGWTFIYCPKPENALEVLKMANKFTKNGKGVVLFIEDIDKILKERNDITNEISLLMDGSETKHNNIISIFSTNHIENIEPTFLRGKRIGSIVTLQHLDASTAEKMLEYHLSEYITGSFKNAAMKVEEYQIVPAFLSEIIDRVKTHSLLRVDKAITEDDILNAIKLYKRQMDIAKVKTNTESNIETISRLNSEIIAEIVNKTIEENGTIRYISEQV